MGGLETRHQLTLAHDHALTDPAAARAVAIVLDGTTLRTGDGQEIATLGASGWIDPEGIPTERVEIPIPVPVAIVSERDRAEHARQADEDWLAAAFAFLRALASEHETFTVDDVWPRLTMPPRDARAQMSRLMRVGEREGLMRLTDDTRPCTRNNGGRRVRIWRSLIHQRRAPQSEAESGDAD